MNGKSQYNITYNYFIYLNFYNLFYYILIYNWIELKKIIISNRENIGSDAKSDNHSALWVYLQKWK